MILLYLASVGDFVPLDINGLPNWYNVLTVLVIFFFLIQSVVSLGIYLVQKFLTCGVKEFPSSRNALKWGFILSFLMIVVIVLNLFHIVSLLWGAVVALFISIALFLLKI